MIVEITGTVTQIKIRQDDLTLGSIEVRDDATGTLENFVLWSYDNSLPPFSNWIARSLNISLARDALINKLKVTVMIDDASSLVIQLVLLAS